MHLSVHLLLVAALCATFKAKPVAHVPGPFSPKIPHEAATPNAAKRAPKLDAKASAARAVLAERKGVLEPLAKLDRLARKPAPISAAAPLRDDGNAPLQDIIPVHVKSAASVAPQRPGAADTQRSLALGARPSRALPTARPAPAAGNKAPTPTPASHLPQMNVFREFSDPVGSRQQQQQQQRHLRASTKTPVSSALRMDGAQPGQLPETAASTAGVRAKAGVDDDTRWTSPSSTALAVEPVDPLMFSTHAWEPIPLLAWRELLKAKAAATPAQRINVSFPLGGVVVDATLPAGRRLTPKALVVFDFFFPCNLGLNTLYITKPLAQEYTASGNTGCVNLGTTRQPTHANQCVFRATIEDNGRGDSDSRLGHLTIHAAVAKTLGRRPTCT